MLITRGSLEVLEFYNGFYLYGQDAETGHKVEIACLGDGADLFAAGCDPLDLTNYGPEWELAEAYNFVY
jgi:hypothetical protein